MFEKPCIIIDNGTYSITAGFGGRDYAETTFLSGKGRTETDYNWDDMEKIWDHIFANKLRVIPDKHNVLLTEAPMNPKANREKMAEIMFDTFNVKGLYLINQCVLSLISAGKSTGMVCDSGHYVSHFVPIFEYYALPNSYFKMNFGGKDITNSLINSLNLSKIKWSSSTAEKTYFESIKKKYCYVAFDFQNELREYQEQSIELPDGTIIKIQDQRFRACEILFQKDLDNPSFEIRQKMIDDYNGFTWNCNSAICKSDIELRNELYQNIVLSGGSTMFQGFPERLTQELKHYYMKKEANAISHPWGLFATWIGGSVAASANSFSNRSISNEEWIEYGKAITWRKIF